MIKTELLTHAWGNLSARDSVEDEESPNSCEDDTMSESSDSEPFFQGAGGGLALILSLCEGGVEINFCLMRGGYDLVLGHISPISEPPLPPPPRPSR